MDSVLVPIFLVSDSFAAPFGSTLVRVALVTRRVQDFAFFSFAVGLTHDGPRFLPALFSPNPDDHAARVWCDYRETVSEIMAQESLPTWAKWAHDHGFITRDQAHGSPGNWLDLYATADIPETEMFHLDRNKLVSKFASSAAHVMGKPLVSARF